jgi:hypothetical protein
LVLCLVVIASLVDESLRVGVGVDLEVVPSTARAWVSVSPILPSSFLFPPAFPSPSFSTLTSTGAIDDLLGTQISAWPERN